MKRLAAGVLGAAVILTACSGTPAAGPAPSGPPSAPPSATQSEAPSARPTGPPAAVPSGWLAEATAGPGPVVLLGDSFASGEGAGGYRSVNGVAASLCHRSRYAVASSLTDTDKLLNLACSRAHTGNLEDQQEVDPAAGSTVPSQLDQLDQLDREPSLVLVSLGGNDVGFARILRACLLEKEPCSSDTELRTATAARISSLEETLTGVYQRLGQRLQAPVLVLPYPQLFDEPQTDCGRLSTAEQAYARELVTELDGAIERAAAAANQPNVRYADSVQEALAGHGACSPDSYVNGAGTVGLLGAAGSVSGSQEILHPTRDGYQAITNALTTWAAENALPAES